MRIGTATQKTRLTGLTIRGTLALKNFTIWSAKVSWYAALKRTCLVSCQKNEGKRSRFRSKIRILRRFAVYSTACLTMLELKRTREMIYNHWLLTMAPNSQIISRDISQVDWMMKIKMGTQIPSWKHTLKLERLRWAAWPTLLTLWSITTANL